MNYTIFDYERAFVNKGFRVLNRWENILYLSDDFDFSIENDCISLEGGQMDIFKEFKLGTSPDEVALFATRRTARYLSDLIRKDETGQ